MSLLTELRDAPQPLAVFEAVRLFEGPYMQICDAGWARRLRRRGRAAAPDGPQRSHACRRRATLGVRYALAGTRAQSESGPAQRRFRSRVPRRRRPGGRRDCWTGSAGARWLACAAEIPFRTQCGKRGEAPMGALDGLRVVDFGQWVAGPLAGMLLADQGGRRDSRRPAQRPGVGHARQRRVEPRQVAHRARPQAGRRPAYRRAADRRRRRGDRELPTRRDGPPGPLRGADDHARRPADLPLDARLQRARRAARHRGLGGRRLRWRGYLRGTPRRDAHDAADLHRDPDRLRLRRVRRRDGDCDGARRA